MDASRQNTMLDNMILMFLMSITTAIITAIVNRMTSFRVGDLATISKKIRGLFEPQLNSIIISDSATLSSDGHRWNKDFGTENNEYLIDAIKAYLVKHQVYSRESKCSLSGCQSLDDRLVDRMLSRDIQLLPLDRIEYNDIIFTCSLNLRQGEDKQHAAYSLLVKLESAKSQDFIRKFIDECYRDYVQAKYGIEFKPYLYKQMPVKEGLRFKKYSLNSKMTFDDVFFPEKEKIIELVNRLRDGNLNKLSLLLHGTPGCGKTSIIKILANYLGYSVIVIKLSFMINDASLDDAFNVSTIFYNQYNDARRCIEQDDVPLDKRIYILEDIDAESDIVSARAKKKSCKSPPSPPINSDQIAKDDTSEDTKKNLTLDDIYSKMMSAWVGEEITLAGFLNAIDGILDLRGVLIMTTNHPEKLDPAIIRPGRITFSLKLREMTMADANKLAIKYFGAPAGNVIEGAITPARMDAFCQTATSIGELREMIDDYQKNK